jgi:hypothetical protein
LRNAFLPFVSTTTAPRSCMTRITEVKGVQLGEKWVLEETNILVGDSNVAMPTSPTLDPTYQWQDDRG